MFIKTYFSAQKLEEESGDPKQVIGFFILNKGRQAQQNYTGTKKSAINILKNVGAYIIAVCPKLHKTALAYMAFHLSYLFIHTHFIFIYYLFKTEGSGMVWRLA